MRRLMFVVWMIILSLFYFFVFIQISFNQILLLSSTYLRKMGLLSMVRSGNFDQTIQYIYHLHQYFQILGLINKIQPTMPEFLIYLQQIISSPIDLMIYALDCFVSGSAFSSVNIRILWGLTLPVILYLFTTVLITLLVVIRLLPFERIYL